MALIDFGSSTCPLCGVVLRSGDDLVATSHFIGSRSDPLWRFSDAAMHRQCFLAWELRPDFVARYNQAVGSRTAGNGTFKRMADDGTIQQRPRSTHQPNHALQRTATGGWLARVFRASFRR